MESNIDKPYKTKFNSLIELKAYLGKELGVTKWYTMDQEKINIFADTTEDRQWIHIDRERSKKESPYKTTIAHGFLMLSMCSKIMFESFELKGESVIGYDKYKENTDSFEDCLKSDIAFLALPTIYDEDKMRYDKSSIHEVCDDLEKKIISEYYQRCFGEDLPESSINVSI